MIRKQLIGEQMSKRIKLESLRSKILHEAIREAEKDLCMHYEGTDIKGVPSSCNFVINAHSIQKSQIDKYLSEGSKVIQLADPKGRTNLVPMLTGTKAATVFRGFCHKHDQLFQEFEEGGFDGSKRHCDLVAYRAICREVYFHRRNIRAFEIADVKAEESGLHTQPGFTPFRSALDRGQEAVGNEFDHIKKEIDECIKNDSPTFDHLVLNFKQSPDLLSAGFFTPEWDFAGNRIQDVTRLPCPFHTLAISIVASPEGFATVLSWHKKNRHAFSGFVSSLLALGSRIGDGLVRLTFEHLDNNPIKPSFWDALPKDAQDQLIARAKRGMNIFDRRTSTVLCRDGFHYADWKLDNYKMLQDGAC